MSPLKTVDALNASLAITAASAVESAAGIGLLTTTQAAQQQGSPAAPATVQTTLSDTAQRLAALLANSDTSVTAPPTTRPLLPAPASTPQELATAMQHGLSHSGLFYESHLADWHQGQRDLNDLRQAPQASLDSSLPEDASTLNAIVRAQLDALDTGQLHWQGELWPGQTIDWRLRQQQQQQQEPQANQESPATRAWHSTVKLNLPVLGEITARLRLCEGQLQLGLSASDSGTARLLAQHSPLLANHCAQAGTPLEHFSIQ